MIENTKYYNHWSEIPKNEDYPHLTFIEMPPQRANEFDNHMKQVIQEDTRMAKNYVGRVGFAEFYFQFKTEKDKEILLRSMELISKRLNTNKVVRI